MSAVLIVSQNNILGADNGRHQQDTRVAYSKHPGFIVLVEAIGRLFATGELGREKKVVTRHTVKTREAHDPEGWFAQDLPSVETVYVFVSPDTLLSATGFIIRLQDLGKRVYLVACKDCDWFEKCAFATQLNLEIVPSECGGEETCGHLFATGAPIQVLQTVELVG